MAIAFGAINNEGNITGSYTSIPVLGVFTLGLVFAIGDTTADNLTAITWGGVSMTKIASSFQPGSDRWCGVWYVTNPTSSSTITMTGGTYQEAHELYYTGVNQLTPIDSSNNGSTGVATSITIATTVVASNCWTIMASKDNGAGNVEYTTSVGVVRQTAVGGGLCLSDSNATVGTGSQSTTQTLNAGAASHAGVAFSIAPTVLHFSPFPSHYNENG